MEREKGEGPCLSLALGSHSPVPEFDLLEAWSASHRDDDSLLESDDRKQEPREPQPVTASR
jgi:hypothetical protein